MGKYTALALDIINNAEKHIVNREEKMNRTIDVMTANAENKMHQRLTGGVAKTDESRGYGHKGIRMGD